MLTWDDAKLEAALQSVRVGYGAGSPMATCALHKDAPLSLADLFEFVAPHLESRKHASGDDVCAIVLAILSQRKTPGRSRVEALKQLLDEIGEGEVTQAWICQAAVTGPTYDFEVGPFRMCGFSPDEFLGRAGGSVTPTPEAEKLLKLQTDKLSVMGRPVRTGMLDLASLDDRRRIPGRESLRKSYLAALCHELWLTFERDFLAAQELPLALGAPLFRILLPMPQAYGVLSLARSGATTELIGVTEDPDPFRSRSPFLDPGPPVAQPCKFLRVYDRFIEAFRQARVRGGENRPLGSLILLFSAIEGLLGEERDITEAVARRLAVLAAPDEPGRVYSKVKKLYDARSRILHGDRSSDSAFPTAEIEEFCRVAASSLFARARIDAEGAVLDGFLDRWRAELDARWYATKAGCTVLPEAEQASSTERTAKGEPVSICVVDNRITPIFEGLLRSIRFSTPPEGERDPFKKETMIRSETAADEVVAWWRPDGHYTLEQLIKKVHRAVRKAAATVPEEFARALICLAVESSKRPASRLELLNDLLAKLTRADVNQIAILDFNAERRNVEVFGAFEIGEYAQEWMEHQCGSWDFSGRYSPQLAGRITIRRKRFSGVGIDYEGAIGKPRRGSLAYECLDSCFRVLADGYRHQFWSEFDRQQGYRILEGAPPVDGRHLQNGRRFDFVTIFRELGSTRARWVAPLRKSAFRIRHPDPSTLAVPMRELRDSGLLEGETAFGSSIRAVARVMAYEYECRADHRFNDALVYSVIALETGLKGRQGRTEDVPRRVAILTGNDEDVTEIFKLRHAIVHGTDRVTSEEECKLARSLADRVFRGMLAAFRNDPSRGLQDFPESWLRDLDYLWFRERSGRRLLEDEVERAGASVSRGSETAFRR